MRVADERCSVTLSVPPLVVIITVAIAAVVVFNMWYFSQPIFPLDVNTASVSHLTHLPGIDEPTAQKIIGGRPYKAKDELMEKNILDRTQYERIKDQIIARQK